MTTYNVFERAYSVPQKQEYYEEKGLFTKVKDGVYAIDTYNMSLEMKFFIVSGFKEGEDFYLLHDTIFLRDRVLLALKMSFDCIEYE